MDDVGRLWTGIGVCAAVILLMAFLTLCENAAVEFNDAKLKKMAEEDKDPKACGFAWQNGQGSCDKPHRTFYYDNRSFGGGSDLLLCTAFK